MIGLVSLKNGCSHQSEEAKPLFKDPPCMQQFHRPRSVEKKESAIEKRDKPMSQQANHPRTFTYPFPHQFRHRILNPPCLAPVLADDVEPVM